MSRKRIIGLLYPAFFPMIGGIETRLYHLGKSLSKLHYEVHVLTNSGNGLPNYEVLNGIRIHRINLPSAPDWPYSPLWPIRAAPKVLEIVENHGIQLIDAQNCTALSAACMVKASKPHLKVVFTLHDVVAKFISVEQRLQLSFFLNGSQYDSLIVPSPVVERDVSSLMKGKSKKVINIIFQGIDTEEFNPRIDRDHIRARLGLGSKDRLIVIPSRIVPHKGIQYAIQALPRIAKKIPHVKILITGNGSMSSTRDSSIAYAKHLNQLVKSLRLSRSVIFGHARFTHNEMPYVFASSELTLLPSLVPEGFGVSLLESMACKKPVVATRGGLIGNLAKLGKHCLVVKPKSPDSIVQQVIRIMTNSKLSETLGNNGRMLVLEKFKSDDMARKTSAIYSDLL